MSNLRVSQLTIYPLKSARGISLTSMTLNSQGPECDRRWMVIDANNRFVTQRKNIRMCLVNVHLDAAGLIISAEGAGQCRVPMGSAEHRSSCVWGTDVSGSDCGDDAANWISEFLEKDCRIIYMDDDYIRLVDTHFAKQKQQVGFADGFPLLVTTQASLDDFNTKLAADSDVAHRIDMNRFRPNIVITGNQAWAEDQWQKISIQDIELLIAKPCSRCIMPSINPNTATRETAVNNALLKHRRRDKKTYFGQNALYNILGEISVGDSVNVLV